MLCKKTTWKGAVVEVRRPRSRLIRRGLTTVAHGLRAAVGDPDGRAPQFVGGTSIVVVAELSFTVGGAGSRTVVDTR